MEGVPAKILVPATLMQVSLWWWLPYVAHTVNDPIIARGVFLILGVQAGAFSIQEAFKRERRLFS